MLKAACKVVRILSRSVGAGVIDPFGPNSVCVLPGTMDVTSSVLGPTSSQPDPQQEQAHRLLPGQHPGTVRQHGQCAGPRQCHSSARGTALQMVGRAARARWPRRGASGSLCPRAHPSNVWPSLNHLRQVWTDAMTVRLLAAIETLGGLSAAMPADVRREMASGGEQGLPTRLQIKSKMVTLRALIARAASR